MANLHKLLIIFPTFRLSTKAYHPYRTVLDNNNKKLKEIYVNTLCISLPSEYLLITTPTANIASDNQFYLRWDVNVMICAVSAKQGGVTSLLQLAE